VNQVEPRGSLADLEKRYSIGQLDWSADRSQCVKLMQDANHPMVHSAAAVKQYVRDDWDSFRHSAWANQRERPAFSKLSALQFTPDPLHITIQVVAIHILSLSKTGQMLHLAVNLSTAHFYCKSLSKRLSPHSTHIGGGLSTLL
jgi:hypothetical protein